MRLIHIATEQIWLESLNGFDFESLCADIFQRLGYEVDHIQYIADKGRDLILHRPDGRKTVVECKHHLDKTIGRPTVQKLHSAVITSEADDGLLVTTGKFSKSAIDYARKVGIELMDLHQLILVAEQVGIKIWRGGQPLRGAFVTQLEATTIQDKLRGELLKRMHSYPRSSEKLIHLSLEAISLYPVYFLKYDVHQDFVTQAGLIHSIHEDNRIFLLDEQGEQVMSYGVIQILADSPMVPIPALPSLVRTLHESKTPVLRGWPLKVNPFEMDITGLMTKAKKMICEFHTKMVGYYGRNNVYYEKECRPSVNRVTIRDVRPCYLSSYRFKVSIGLDLYKFEVTMRSSNLLILSTNLSCQSCRKRIKNDLLVCNVCWHVSHAQNCSSYCEGCNKTVCSSCSYWKYKTPGVKVRLCPTCALQDAKRGKAVFAQ